MWHLSFSAVRGMDPEELEEMIAENDPSIQANAARPSFKDGPSLWPHLSLYLEAFWDLQNDRQVNYVPITEHGFTTKVRTLHEPIPWRALNEYALRYGYTDLEAFERFTHFVSALDRTWLNYQAEKRK